MLKLPRAAKQKAKYQKSANEQLQKNNIRVLFVPSTLRRALENLSDSVKNAAICLFMSYHHHHQQLQQLQQHQQQDLHRHVRLSVHINASTPLVRLNLSNDL